MSDIPVHYPLGGYYTSGEVDSLLGAKANSSHAHTLSDVTDAGTAAALNVPATGNAASGEVVKGSDTRLTDARIPTSHTHTLSDVTDAGTAASHNVAASGNAASGEVVKGNDTRLVDARTPLSHTHTLSSITDAGTAASKNVPATGNASATECVLGNDTRLGGGDAVVPIGGIIFYDSGITGATYPTGTFAKCEGGSLPDLRGKFLLPDATPGGTSSTSTHSHTPSFTSYNVTPCGGGGNTVAGVDITLDSVSHMPPYHKLITLARTA